MTIHSQILAKLNEHKKLAEASTPGPWEAFDDEILAGDGLTCVVTPKGFRAHEPTLEFIAAAREGWPATNEALRIAVENFRAQTKTKCTECGDREAGFYQCRLHWRAYQALAAIADTLGVKR